MADNNTNPDPKKVVEALRNGSKIQPAMLEAGYAPNVARKGRRALTKAMIEQLVAEGIELAKIGGSLDKKHVEEAIAGTLYTNMLTGESKGNEAAKLLGSMVKYEAFRSDSNTNLIVLADIRQEQLAPDHVLTNQPVTTLNANDVE